MNNQNQENMKELFEKFLDTKQAQKYVHDFFSVSCDMAR